MYNKGLSTLRKSKLLVRMDTYYCMWFDNKLRLVVVEISIRRFPRRVDFLRPILLHEDSFILALMNYITS